MRRRGEHAGAVVVALTAALVLATVLPRPASARTVLVEMFGSMTCADCLAARLALDTLESELGENVVAIEYHSQAPLSTVGGDARASYYGVTAEPTALFDGANAYTGSSSLPDTYRERALFAASQASPVTIEAVSLFTESTRAGSLAVEVRVEDIIPSPEDVVLRAVVFETGVDACCSPGGGRTWNRVVRRVLDDRLLGVGLPGQIRFERWELPLAPDWSVDGLGAVVFLQRTADRTVLGAAPTVDAGGLLPLPYSGLDESRVNLLPCRPNPLRSGNTRILFTLPAADHAKVQILDAAGRVVRVLTDGPRPSGVQEVLWDGRDWTGRWMAAGLYVYRLETSRGVQARKLTLIR